MFLNQEEEEVWWWSLNKTLRNVMNPILEINLTETTWKYSLFHYFLSKSFESKKPRVKGVNFYNSARYVEL